MKRGAALVAVLAIVLLGATKPDGAKVVDPSAQFGVRVTVWPSTQETYQLLPGRVHPDTYTCRADVYDIDDERVALALPTVIVAPGQSGTDTKRFNDVDVTFTVAISKDSTRAMTRISAKRDGKNVMHQESEVTLRPGAGRVLPLR
jgi:hypothetical protein